MLDKLLFRSLPAIAGVMLLMGTAGAVEIETVPVGNLGNTDDTHGDGYGAVNYAYNIGKYEVTAGQYTEFLNAVDPDGTNPHGLYNDNMDSNTYGCQITWNSDSSTYDFSGAPSGTVADWQDRPVNYVSWYDAAMFANWMTSGNVDQGAYDTSPGAGWGDSNASNYTGITAHDSPEMGALVVTYGKVWVIPTEDEWYKAAYHKNDGDTGNYFDYPTSSDTAPGYVDNSGNLSGTGNPFVEGGTDPGNYATYDGDSETVIRGIGGPYYRTEVGEWENSDSPYGTFDQGGNVWEWNETLIDASRGWRGGSFSYLQFADSLHASDRYYFLTLPPHEYNDIGFRVASVPEPTSITLLVCGALGLLAYRRRRRKC